MAFCSTHFDHRSKEAMKNSSALMAERMKAFVNADVVITVGDLNTTLEEGLLQPLQDNFSNARTEAPGSDLYTGTFNGFGSSNSLIDHIYYSGGKVTPLRYWVDRRGYGVPLLSDHYPILLKLDYNK